MSRGSSAASPDVLVADGSSSEIDRARLGIIAGESGAAENYLAFLSAGASRYPLDALRLAGVDMIYIGNAYAKRDGSSGSSDARDQPRHA